MTYFYLILLSVVLVLHGTYAMEESPVVSTSYGRVQGNFNTSLHVYQFLGLSYASPPTNERRWQPPSPPQPWNETRPATEMGPDCPQRGLSSPDTDEDCLRLALWTPYIPGGGSGGRGTAAANSKAKAKANSKADAAATNTSSVSSSLLPVLVFFHGGSLVVGGTMAVQAGNGAVASLASPNRTAAPPSAANSGFVSVSVNYRLGVAGFLAVDALAANDERGGGRVGNYGLLDCIAALRWVADNAGAFGGDPKKVTVYGQSSGGSLTLSLLASPLARGLFSAAYSMSGSPRLNSTTAEANAYWHRQPILKSRCAPLLPPPPPPSMSRGGGAAAAAAAAASSPPPPPAGVGGMHGVESAEGDELLKCLYSLTADELVAMMPDNWDAASFGFGVFQANCKLSLRETHVEPAPYVI